MKQFKALKYWLPIITAVTFMLGVLLGVWLKRVAPVSPGREKLEEILEIIDDQYVDSVDIDSLIEHALPAFLETLDPHSAYIAAKDLAEINADLEGSFSGIGIQFQIYNDTVCVVEVIPTGPSERAGIMPGDRIIAVDGKELIPSKLESQDDILRILRGPKGSKVKLTVMRGKKRHDFVVTRDDIPVKSIDASYMLDSRTGYVKISRFARTTYQEFINAMSALYHQGARDYVLDLRGNTGGYMEPALMMINEFLPEGKVIVSTRGRNKEQDQIVLSQGNGAFQNARVTVLTDETSASASEIFAGAMQDNDRGLVIGRRSFGKGLVQAPITLSDSSQIRLTIQRYYTPSGRCIQKDYKLGERTSYDYELIDRYKNGELMNADSAKIHKELMFKTGTGRTVYGGGGIMPDIFVPNDTTGITGYYVNVYNAGLLQRFAYEYADLNRDQLHKITDVKTLLKNMPSDTVLIESFAHFAASNGIPARWYYINLSTPLIVTQLKALIARNTLGVSAYYEVMNTIDNNISRALKALRRGEANFPIRQSNTQKTKKK